MTSKPKDYLRRVLQPVLTRTFRRITASRFFRRQLFSSTPEPYLAVTTLDGDSFIVSSSDQVIARDMFELKKAWDLDLLVKAMQIIPNGSKFGTLIDLGANIGSISIGAVSKGLFQRAFAFEPDDNNFRILGANVVLNGLEDKVYVKHLALTDELNQVLTLELSSTNHGDHRIRNNLSLNHEILDLFEEGKRRTIKVSSSTLDSELAKLLGEGFEFPALLFMDVQGWEGHVLRGARKFLAQNSQQGGALIIEYWPYGLRRASGLQFLHQALLQSGYSSVVDLSMPPNHCRLDEKALDALALRYSENSDSTDLLIY
jgi:FkbM family methyltransferase